MGSTSDTVGMVIQPFKTSDAFTLGALRHPEELVLRQDKAGFYRPYCGCSEFAADGIICKHVRMEAEVMWTDDPIELGLELVGATSFGMILPLTDELYVAFQIRDYTLTLADLDNRFRPNYAISKVMLGHLRQHWSLFEVRRLLIDYIFSRHSSNSNITQCHSSSHKGSTIIAKGTLHSNLIPKIPDMYIHSQTGMCRSCFDAYVSVSSIAN